MEVRYWSYYKIGTIIVCKKYMIKKTYYIESPAKLSLQHNQIIIDQGDGSKLVSRDLDDAGMILLDHQNINLTVPLLQTCLEKNIIITACNQKHLPVGLWLPLHGHSQSGGRMRSQIEATKPFKKKLWQLIFVYVKDTFLLKMKAIQNVWMLVRSQLLICQRYFFIENESNSKLSGFYQGKKNDMSKILFY